MCVSVYVHVCVFLHVYTMCRGGHACTDCLWLIYGQMDIAAELQNCIFNQLCGGVLTLKDALNLKMYIL